MPQLCLLVFAFFLPVQLWAETYTSPFGQVFVKISSGSFVMGNENFDELAFEVDPGRLTHLRKELPPHRVTISQDFWIATTEVTQGLWLQLMGYKRGKKERWLREDWAELPVSRVSWKMVQQFIETINELDTDFQYRLPTEAEWEYAARAGTRGLRPFPYEQMAEYAWYRESSGNKPMPVGSLKPNAWGLHDMIGNVWEWVNDSYSADYYQHSPELDPKGPDQSLKRKVMRGGSYHCTPERVRVGIRGSYVQHKSLSTLGFRLVAEPKQPR